MMLHQSFVSVHQKLLHILLGLNCKYYSGFKWLDMVTEKLVIKPVNLTHRPKKVYLFEPAEGAKSLTTLVEETYNLIEVHLPEVDVDWLRHVFRYQHPALDQASCLEYDKRIFS
jgi:hypothetical protein